jgi:hypothetical protein
LRFKLYGSFSSVYSRAETQFAASKNRGFQFQKRRQLFIRPHNETLSLVKMRISNDRSPVGIHG